MAPLWMGQILTGTKSFADNPVLASGWLNRHGLHAARVALAHRLAARRRRRLAALVPAADREAFDRDGFVLRRDFLPPDEFAALLAQVRAFRGTASEVLQGDALTRKIVVHGETLARLPALKALIGRADWQALVRYAGARDSAPLVYIQSIFTHAVQAPPDPQTALHADTFHPTVKAWLFLTDVAGEAPPFTYVPGSHCLTPARLAWERRMSLQAARAADEHTRQGSFRIAPEELAALGLPPPRAFRVPANTLIVADTFGFHARGPSDRPALRAEIWAYGERSPFLLPRLRLPRALRRLTPARPTANRTRRGVSAFDPPRLAP